MWGLFFSPPKSSKCTGVIDILSFETRKIRQKLTNWASQNVILELLELFGSSWGRLQLGRTFIFKNGRPASTGARFLKPVRARTGSELQRERILSLGIKRELGRESEKTRREAKERITTRYLIPSYTRAWRHESKTASRLESPRAWVHESMRVREHEGSRARKRESMTSWDGLTCALRALVGDVEGGCILIANYNPSIFTI